MKKLILALGVLVITLNAQENINNYSYPIYLAGMDAPVTLINKFTPENRMGVYSQVNADTSNKMGEQDCKTCTETDSTQMCHLELESQIGCFTTKGGYHISAGVRYGNFRFRAEMQHGGTMNFEQLASKQNENFERFMDSFSGGAAVDYFLCYGVFVSASVESRNWKVRNVSTGGEEKLRTVDFGVAPGIQLFIWEKLYFQASVGFNFRESKSITIDNAKFEISGVDFLPMLRIGYRL